MGVGSGRTFCTTAKTITSSSASGVQIFTRRTAVRSGVSGGGGVLVSSASMSSGGRGGNGCCVVRSGLTVGTGAVASAGAGAGAGAAGAAGFRVAGSSSGLSATNLLVRSASFSGAPLSLVAPPIFNIVVG